MNDISVVNVQSKFDVMEFLRFRSSVCRVTLQFMCQCRDIKSMDGASWVVHRHVDSADTRNRLHAMWAAALFNSWSFNNSME